ncbi:heme-binding protein [Endozoicomonas sp. ISHI1]|uniref:GlcG/HbpS family heme-binding protein n=1 Tax=Endozoicomonas sp. ISHI1 TaxID=2825882 RepID=UPI002148AB42|nr:heme-binding protein [Endozoicomonas sp. ISHI1]
MFRQGQGNAGSLLYNQSLRRQHHRDNEKNIKESTMKKSIIALAFIATGLAIGAQAKTTALPTLTDRAAIELVNQGLQFCRKDGYNVSVAVVDRTGSLKAFGRSELAGPHTVDSAQKKAFTAASMGQPTANLAKLVTDKPFLQGLKDMDARMLLLGGGMPIKVDGQIVGGIGIGGAPGGHLDQACAEQAIKITLK